MSVVCIVPLGPNEPLPFGLINSLSQHEMPMILSATKPCAHTLPRNANWLEGSAGRPQQLNQAIRHSSADWLWMVHADSLISAEAPKIIQTFCAGATWQAIGYGRLRFANDGPLWTRLNQWGANLRALWWDQPYGDQALCIHRKLWARLSGFSEDLARGEDLDLVIRARSMRARFHRLPFTVTTSARRYQSRGWLKTTIEHQMNAWRLIRNAKQWQP